MNAIDASFLRTLCSLRWLATAGQAATIVVATEVFGLPLPLGPLWAGVAALALFNLYAGLSSHWLRGEVGPATAFGHLLVDITILTWMVGWSGGLANPFGSLFVVLVALAAMALPPRWTIAVAAASVVGYAVSAVFGLPLPGGRLDPRSLHLGGMAASFLITTVVVLVFSTRLSGALRERERELSVLRDRFTRNEGIVALATHAASVAHELNTPLATMTLLVGDMAEQADDPVTREDLETLDDLLAQCREKVQALAAPADSRRRQPVSLAYVLQQWQLVRPTVQLDCNADAPLQRRVEPAIGHLLQVLLNNAADAGEAAQRPGIDLALHIEDGTLYGEVRDHGAGFDTSRPLLPGTTLFGSGKPHGMGVGLALSHATVERLRGDLWMRPAGDGPGTRVGFRLPLQDQEDSDD